MILTCPECATSYFVDDSRVTSAGRTVKCSNCGAKWTARPEGASEAAPPPAPKPVATPVAAPPPETDDVVTEAPEAPAETPFVPPKPARPEKPRADSKVLVLAAAAGLIVALVAGVVAF